MFKLTVVKTKVSTLKGTVVKTKLEPVRNCVYSIIRL